ncbi:MAG: holliday junction resolvasome, helicase subunit [Pseudomonas sp. PGPPP3]|nr:MAG: holliday junction resolvasome, helicase subunit [Pseudomonas sp. PGPPP3]
MSPFRLFAAAGLLSLATSASATSFVVTTDWIADAFGSSSDATSSTKDDKVIRAARDAAASFVATNGAIRGAQLEAALLQIREHAPQLQASDAQLAEAILSH